MGVEIERKFTVKELPDNLEKYPCRVIEQGYLNVHPAVRVRREDDSYYMTYKGQNATEGGIGKIEYNMPLDKESYEHLCEKADGNVIKKKRYLIPINEDAYTLDYLAKRPDIEKMIVDGDIKIELDVFGGVFEGRILAEVEFPDEEAAENYQMASFFLEDVTGDVRYSNAHMSSEVIGKT